MRVFERLGTGLAIIGGGVPLGTVVGQALTGIAKTALYVYARETEPPHYFEDMDFGGIHRNEVGE